jgi:hybrid cluster-associated redox disulfide protein
MKIDLDMPIMELIALYPELAPVLTYEYGLYCMNCIIADFDTLRNGAALHEIEGIYLTQMITHLESIINTNEDE